MLGMHRRTGYECSPARLSARRRTRRALVILTTTGLGLLTFLSLCSTGWMVPARQNEPHAVISSVSEPRIFLPLVSKSFRRPFWGRLGFGQVQHVVEQYDVAQLHAGWYLDWSVRPDPPSILGLVYVPLIWISESGYSPNQAEIVDFATQHRGSLWLIGNEPDDETQGCVTPASYAELYHEVYHIIKAADPHAQIANGGVVQATPLRLQYMDMIVQEYQDEYGEMIPVDVWNVHGFILREEADNWGCQIPCGITATQGMLYELNDHDNMIIFQDQIVAFRQWMADKGERNKPLIVSEYGILAWASLGFDAPRVQNFMLATFDFFVNATDSSLGYPADDNKLVQAWNWYSLDGMDFEGGGSYNHLFHPVTKQITDLGRAYGNYAVSVP